MSPRVTPRVRPLGDSPRILLVRLGAIGDVVNALIVANALRSHVPGAHIGWATHPLSASLVDGHRSIDTVHVWQKKGGLRGLRALIGEIRRAKYDVAIDLQRLQKSSLLARLSGASRVLGFDRARSKELSWLWTAERIEPGHPREHMVDQYRRFLPLLGVPTDPIDRSLVESPKAAAWAKNLVLQECRGAAPILLNLGASKEDKRWPETSFLELSRSLIARAPDVPLILTGGPGDISTGESLVKANPTLIQLAGKTTLPELIALIRRSRGMVTGDTGAMHMAAALGTPTVALFGPSDPIRTGPYGRGQVILLNNLPVDRDDPNELSGARRRFPMSGTAASTVAHWVDKAFLTDPN